MVRDDPFSAEFEAPKSEFNVALATAFYVHNLRVAINKAIWEKNYVAASDLLSSISCEIEGYYLSKRTSEETKKIIFQLKQYETKNKNLVNSTATNKDSVLKEQIKVWRNYLITRAHVIWFSQEKTNIYGDDYD